MASKDYYNILGVAREATPEQIKKAYYKLAHEYHPDKKGGDEAKFKEVNEAYQVLSNKEKRAQYDRFGSDFKNAGAGGFNGTNVNWEDFTSGFGGQDINLEDIFDMFGGGFRGSARKDNKRGRDLEVSVSISLESVLKDQVEKIKINKFCACEKCSGSGREPGTSVKQCSTCGGSGKVREIKRTMLGDFAQTKTCPDCGGEGSIPEKKCSVCNGEGRIEKQETIEIRIPEGIDTDQVIKLKGKGDFGRKGGEAGDLYVRVFIKEHPVFKREGDNLFMELPITISQAVLGDKIKIETLEKKQIFVKIPSSVQSGKVLKVSKRGISHSPGFGRGDLYIELIVKTPQNLTREQKELFTKLKKEGL
ncbi:MAG: molecular chaperone DnaJ [Candidatus Pacebacteria bacterium]|nr:molecular chaperone DnaJ [Candidatus Paceibacterota bacterium]MDD3918990.1 molecular chaperone DnaJ [Candidatus Paceibacterota bacterium]